MAEDGGDLVAPRALHVHEVAVGVLDKPLQFVLPLLLLWARVQQVLRELWGGNTNEVRSAHLYLDGRGARVVSNMEAKN